MARRQNVRHSIYDVMEDVGVFDSNPANVSSPEYKKAEYPRMFYHPMGEEKITRPAEIVQTPIGPQAVGEQREMIYALANDEEEEKKFRLEGWHDHPAAANIAAGRKPGFNVKSQAQRIADLEKELAMLKGPDAEPAKPVVTSLTGTTTVLVPETLKETE